MKVFWPKSGLGAKETSSLIYLLKEQGSRGDEFFYGEGKITSFLGEINRKEKTVELRADMTNFNPLIISKALNLRHDLGGNT